VPACLTDTIRSRSFSLPQRFEPARASWLCFAPHPPIGFRPPEPFPLGQPRHLSMPVALLPFRPAPASTRVAPSFHLRPYLALSRPEPLVVRPRITVFARATLTAAPGICRTAGAPKCVRRSTSGQDRRPGVSAMRPQWRIRVCERSVEAASDRQEPTTSEPCSNRESVLETAWLDAPSSRCSLDLLLLRGRPAHPLGGTLPSCACSEANHCARRHRDSPLHRTSGYRSG
jgi:hypothetical protein